MPTRVPAHLLHVCMHPEHTIHVRDAGAKFAEILGAAGFGGSGVPGMLHCFTGNGEELQQCLDLGLHIGITGWVSGSRRRCCGWNASEGRMGVHVCVSAACVHAWCWQPIATFAAVPAAASL